VELEMPVELELARHGLLQGFTHRTGARGAASCRMIVGGGAGMACSTPPPAAVARPGAGTVRACRGDKAQLQGAKKRFSKSGF
jgi:hypothetical protein